MLARIFTQRAHNHVTILKCLRDFNDTADCQARLSDVKPCVCGHCASCTPPAPLPDLHWYRCFALFHREFGRCAHIVVGTYHIQRVVNCGSNTVQYAWLGEVGQRRPRGCFFGSRIGY